MAKLRAWPPERAFVFHMKLQCPGLPRICRDKSYYHAHRHAGEARPCEGGERVDQPCTVSEPLVQECGLGVLGLESRHAWGGFSEIVLKRRWQAWWLGVLLGFRGA